VGSSFMVLSVPSRIGSEYSVGVEAIVSTMIQNKHDDSDVMVYVC
jgi:hypothetical protein